MNTIKIVAILLTSLNSLNSIFAQTLNWNSLKTSKHIVYVGIGWDYSLTYSLGYGYQVNTEIPLILNANFSIPSGEKLLDDIKTKLGGQILFLNKPHLKGSTTLNGIYRRYESPLVKLQNFGAEVKGTIGCYKSKWFVAGEVGFDKAIITHFKHSDSFKENVFQEVKDGWFQTVTGGNFLFGLQTGYSFMRSDLTFNIGMVKTQDFKSSPLIPYYLMFGYNYRIH